MPGLPPGFHDVSTGLSRRGLPPHLTVSSAQLVINQALYRAIGRPDRIRVGRNGARLCLIASRDEGYSIRGNLTFGSRGLVQATGLPPGRYPATIADGIAYIEVPA